MTRSDNSTATVYIPALLGLGANLGDRKGNMISAWNQIGMLASTRLLRLSSFYETEPVGGPPGQPLYLNAVGLIETELTVFELLEELNRIEQNLHRERTIRRGPRTIDLDILLFGNEVVSSEKLTVPHAEMASRRFVLEPANEIVPDMKHAVTNLTVSEMFARLTQEARVSE